MLDASLFPPSAKFCWMRTAVPRQGAPTDLTRYLSLHPLEQALVTHSVDKRKAEFGDARWCAHQALEALGRDSSKPILRGERGMPLWPSSVSGSLTHTDGFRRVGLCRSVTLLRQGSHLQGMVPTHASLAGVRSGGNRYQG